MPKRPVRSAIFAFVLGGLGYGGYFAYQQVTEKDRVIAELEQRLDRVWSDELVADIRVDKISTTATGDEEMRLTFIQYQAGSETPSFERQMVLPGKEFYVDALVVKFQRSFVEKGDALRGKSLLMFRRAFGDQQKPVDGISLYRADDDSTIPQTVQVDDTPTPFERSIWNRFWELASDPDAAQALGIAHIQGEAPHLQPVEGQVYKLTLKAAGGLDIAPRLPKAALPKDRRAGL